MGAIHEIRGIFKGLQGIKLNKWGNNGNKGIRINTLLNEE